MEDVGVKLLLDQHLSRRLVQPLSAIFPGTTHVQQHMLLARSDDAIWEFALKGGWTIVTKDSDFRTLSFLRGHPPKVILVHSGNGPSEVVLEILTRARSIIEHFASDVDHSLLDLP